MGKINSKWQKRKMELRKQKYHLIQPLIAQRREKLYQLDIVQLCKCI
jgi:hypothetical protein